MVVTTRDQDEDVNDSLLYLDNDSSLGVHKKEPSVLYPRLYETIAYLCFIVLGATVLLPWNTLIVIFPYLATRLEDSAVEKSYASWVSLMFTFLNLLFLGHANLSQRKSGNKNRITLSIIALSISLFVLSLLTKLDSLSPNVFFVFLLLLCTSLSGSSSYLQNAVVAMSSSFGPLFLQACMSGQAIVGVATSVLQMTSAAATSDTDDIGQSRSRSTFIFLCIVTVFSIASLICHVALQSPQLKSIANQKQHDEQINNNDDNNNNRQEERQGLLQDEDQHDNDYDDNNNNNVENETEAQTKSRLTKLLQVEKKVRFLGLSVMYIFVVTLTVFPSITTSITSTSQQETFWTRVLFIPFSFVVFNIGDWVGRSLPGWKRLQWCTNAPNKSDINKLCLASLARTIFIPIFLACNVSSLNPSSSSKSPLINSDFAYILVLFVFAISNGYMTTLIMIAGIQDTIVPPAQIELAATILTFYLVLGLSLGSLGSFAARASLCSCNPFLQT